MTACSYAGVARCLTFGGARHRVLHDPSIPPRNELTKDEYLRQKNTTTINHFYEKLVTLKDRMKTKVSSGIRNGGFVAATFSSIRTQSVSVSWNFVHPCFYLHASLLHHGILSEGCISRGTAFIFEA
jgi:hypothetical protein